MAKGALTRIADIVRADVDGLLNRLEDPGKMARQIILDMEETVDEAIRAVGSATANERLLERRVGERQAVAERWQQKAEQAMEAGEEELARKALQQKVVVSRDVDELNVCLEEAREATAQLKGQLARLRTKLQEARNRQRSLIVRQRAAHRGEGGASRIREDAFDRFEALCNRVDREEVEAEVYAQVVGSQPELDDTFEKLEQKQRVEEELRTLKRKVSGEGMGTPEG